MARKGKGKTNLGEDEITFQDSCIDVKSFAYDVIKYTSLKFGLEEGNIPVWRGKDNDYRCDDLFLVVCRGIIRHQIFLRYLCFSVSERQYELNKLASFHLVGKLLKDLMALTVSSQELTIFCKVEVSLAVLGELILYLVTKDKDLYLKQLLPHWFNCHFKDKKQSFEIAGGLTKFYLSNNNPKFVRYDDFHNVFITNRCLPYKDTASNDKITELYKQSFAVEIERNKESFPELYRKINKEVIMFGENVVKPQPEHKDFNAREKIVVPPRVKNNHKGYTPRRVKPDEDSGVNLPVNTGLGIPQHHELYGVGGPLGAAAPSTQDLPGASPDEKPKRGKRPSAREKMQMRKANPRPTLEQSVEQLSLDSSKTKQSMKKRAN